MQKIKVLHLITHLGFGGASDNTLLTVEELSRQNYEVHLAAGTDYVDWVDRGREAADQFFLFPNLCRAPRLLADLRLLWQLTRFLRRERYTIVHTHNAKAGVIGRLAAYMARVPIILHTMHLLSWQDMETSAPSRFQKIRMQLLAALFFQLEKSTAGFSDKVITVSQLNREESIKAGLAPPSKLVNIYSGIAYDQFQVQVDKQEKCQKLGLNPNEPIIGFIGRLSPQKAPLDFIEAAFHVLETHPNAQFVIVGDGPLADDVQQAVGKEAQIKVLGYRNDVPELLAIIDIFALSSLWEGLGRALTEAMSLGIPVVVTAVNGVPELVEEKQTGLLSPPGDPQALADNLHWCLSNPEEAVAMGKRGQERVLPHFGASQMIHEIEALYQTLLARTTNASVRKRLPTMEGPADA